MEINIDKSNWSKVNFGDVAIQMKGTVDRDNTDLRYYVKGEHMNSEDVHIREFGELTDEYLGPAFIRHFKEGDILYGSRRTYLKKVAVAHFEGITSNTTFVINAKENVIDKRLLPFLMLSDKFTEHSIMHSKGSVNPYINWKDLANYEFLLPPKEQQAELAELLWAMDTVIEKDLEVLERFEKLFQSQSKVYFSNKNHSWNIEKLGKICQVERGGSPRPIDDYITDGEGYNWIKIGDVEIGSKYITSTKQKIKKEGLNKTRLVNIGDLILSNSMSFGRPYILKIDGCIHDGWLVIHDQNNKFNKEFLYYFFSSNTTYNQLKSFAAGGVVDNLNSDIVKKMDIVCPPFNEQIKIANELSEIDKQIELVESKLQSSKALQKALINQVF